MKLILGKINAITLLKYNKKVLLRECKRHTDHGVSSTTRHGVPLPGQVRWKGGVPEVEYPPARSDWGGGVYLRWGTPRSGYPPPGLTGGYSRWGTPQPGYPWPGPIRGVYLRWGTPCQVTPWPGLMGGVPEVGYPNQVHPPPDGPGRGTPPHPRCGLTNKVKLLPPISYYVRGR